jgi:hypoxia up-regulated 1
LQDQITSIILTGGASRTPMIKDAVTRALGADKIAVNVNADEAAVLGAAFYGAGLSRQFKTKDIRVQDITVHDVIASYPAEKRGKTLSATIFPSGAKTGTRKTMTFKRKEDFPLTLAYKGSPAPGFPIQILEAHISGIPEAVKNLTDLGASDVVVKAMIALSESGFASVKEAYVIGELKEDESFTGWFQVTVTRLVTDAMSRETERSLRGRILIREFVRRLELVWYHLVHSFVRVWVSISIRGRC